jgi:branched-subunit amino acid transport protein
VTALVAALALAVVCWVLRVLLVAVVPTQRLPREAHEALEFLAPAVLASLVAVDLVAALRGSDILVSAWVLAGTAAMVLLVRRTGSLAGAVAVAVVVAVVADLLLA